MKTLPVLTELSNPLCFWLDFTGTLLAGAAVFLLILGMKKAFNDRMRPALFYSLGAIISFLFGFFLIMLSKLYQ